MKKSIKIWLIAAMVSVSGSMWGDVTMPKGTYYFDLSALTGDNQAWSIEVFNNINSESYIGFSTDSACNSGVTQKSAKVYENTSTGFNQLVLTISTAFDKGGGFLQVRVGSANGSTTWKGWWDYTAPTAIGGKEIYVCKVTTTGYEWITTLPSCAGMTPSDPTLSFSSGANGSITTQTAGGVYVSSGAEVATGTSINLVATPNTGYAFYGWSDASDNIISTNANYVFSMPSSSITLRALFYADNTDPAINGCSGCFRIAP